MVCFEDHNRSSVMEADPTPASNTHLCLAPTLAQFLTHRDRDMQEEFPEVPIEGFPAFNAFTSGP